MTIYRITRIARKYGLIFLKLFPVCLVSMIFVRRTERKCHIAIALFGPFNTNKIPWGYKFNYNVPVLVDMMPVEAAMMTTLCIAVNEKISARR